MHRQIFDEILPQFLPPIGARGKAAVESRVIPWPPEPLRIGVALALRGYLQAEDWFYERQLST